MEINHLEKFRSVVDAGNTASGTVITSTDSALSELAADCGFDFVWIDMEHSPMTIVDAMHHVMALRGTDCAPFIRVPWNVHYLLKPVLDLAPAGVIVPMVNSGEEARKAVAACRYPTDGGERGFALRRADGYGKMPLGEYLEHARHEPLVIIQVEHREAVEKIDEILATPGVDSICIGPFDLSASYGTPGDFTNPEVIAAIDLVREKTLAAGILLGGFCPGPFWEKRFMHWKALAADTGALASAYRKLISNHRSGR